MRVDIIAAAAAVAAAATTFIVIVFVVGLTSKHMRVKERTIEFIQLLPHLNAGYNCSMYCLVVLAAVGCCFFVYDKACVG